MKLLPRPGFDQVLIFDACAASVEDAVYREKLGRLRPSIQQLSRDYSDRASHKQLYTLAASHHGDPEQIVYLDLNKKELISLYETHMVKKPQGRRYYDEILLSATFMKCTYCGFGQATTLDHFASKSRYPLHSIESSNLIPACADCNKLLGSAPISEASQLPHPYFEDARIELDSWLSARILHTAPATVEYSVVSPPSWDERLARRVRNYFRDLELHRRFSIEGNAAIVEIGDSLHMIEDSRDRATHLHSIALAETNRRRNSWRAALCNSLATSDWYIEIGYLGR
ncbi:HNH endonuclease [Pseudoxanthomonas sp.]|uniref:HNH endonuclease n=1 Tax=Pseudoxanthomonas sp. TaxID=1871049 RepID=UPI0035B2A977